MRYTRAIVANPAAKIDPAALSRISEARPLRRPALAGPKLKTGAHVDRSIRAPHRARDYIGRRQSFHIRRAHAQDVT